MKFVITIINRLLPKELPKPTGRWRIEKCNNQIDCKIDLSNEDHCGPCGQYALTKINNEIKPLEIEHNRVNNNSAK
jgi:hypothetical protein